MLIITDGMPYSVSDTQAAEARLRTKGFITIAIDISATAEAANVFTESISTQDMDGLAPALAKSVKTRLQKQIRRIESV